MKNAVFSSICFSVASIFSFVIAAMNDSALSCIAGLFFLAGAVIEYKNRNKDK